MNPTRPPVPSPPGKVYSAEAMHVPLSLYGMHVNAAVAGPSTQRLPPRSNASPTSLYAQNLAQQQQQQQQRASWAPPLPSKPPVLSSPLPASLMPGGAGRSRPGVLSSLESTLLFQPSMASSATSSSEVSKSRPHSGNAFPARSPLPPPPPIPPKFNLRKRPSVASLKDTPAPEIPPKPFISSEKEKGKAFCPDTDSEEEDALVARAMELSLKDSGPVGYPDLEDGVLARVLEESMTPINTPPMHDARACQDSDSRQHERIQPSSSSCEPSSNSGPFIETPSTSIYSQSIHDNASDQNSTHVSADADLEELVKREQELIRAEDEARRKQMEMDEEFARNIARMEADSPISSPSHSTPPTSVPPTGYPFPSVAPSTPPVNNAAPPYSFHAAASSQQDQSTMYHPLPPLPTAGSPYVRPASADTSGPSRGYATSTANAPPDSGPPAPPYDRLGRSVSAQAALPSYTDVGSHGNSALPRLSLPPCATRPNTVIPVQNRPRSVFEQGGAVNPNGRSAFELETSIRASSAGQCIGPTPSEEAELNGMDDSPVTSPISVTGDGEGRLVSNASPSSPPIVEEELLLGVSFGFNSPPLTISIDPMQGPVPNIITLPYGKFPPLHIQAPTWKDLLKLLARLSDSRIEPTVEALAATKSELKLRTVIQFMRVHHSSTDWRTIIYLTINIPPPPLTPDTHKYTNGDVNTFPYSYTLTPLPTLLRAGVGDSNYSKCFTVPATPNVPYPTLPMALPDLALYLLAVLDESRRAAGDSSGGLRKLAKMIDSTYPADALTGIGPELDVPDKRGMSKFFRRLGRGSKESQNQRGGNTERFEFITPFRIDEYH